jgi:hypothetical protein
VVAFEIAPVAGFGLGRRRQLLMASPRRIRFSWRALLLAPWPALLAVSALLTPPPAPGGSFAWGALLLLAAIGTPLAYAGTAMLAACLHLLSQRRSVGRATSCLGGFVLAGAIYLAVLGASWSSSGPDSGPPVESFLTYLLREATSPFAWLFLGPGVVTALLYDFLATRSPSARAPQAVP